MNTQGQVETGSGQGCQCVFFGQGSLGVSFSYMGEVAAAHLAYFEITGLLCCMWFPQVTAPTWVGDASVVAWLRDTLGLPLTWIHTAQVRASLRGGYTAV
jgi:hypothetical protein